MSVAPHRFFSTTDPFITVAELCDRFHRDLGVRVRVGRRGEDGHTADDVDGLERLVGNELVLVPAADLDDPLGAVVLTVRRPEDSDRRTYDAIRLAGKPDFTTLKVVAVLRPVTPGRDEAVPGLLAALGSLYPGGVEETSGDAHFSTDTAVLLGTVEPAARRAATSRAPEPGRPGLLGWVSRWFGV